jgi:hypothetical protein
MEIYEVQLCPHGHWDRQQSRIVAARDEEDAAYKVTGERLTRDGNRGKARLRVVRLGNGSPPPTMFYAG